MKKFLVLRGYGSEYLDCSPCVLVEMDDRLRKSILDRVQDVQKLAEKHGTSLHGASFFDYSGEWFDLYSLDDKRGDIEDFQLRMEDEALVELSEDDPILKHIQEKTENGQYDGGAHIRTDCDMMEVTTDKVFFKMYVKHTDFAVDSKGINPGCLSSVESDAA